MLESKHRIEELEKSAADFDLLALLSCNAQKRSGIRQLAHNFKVAARNLRRTPPDDGSTPFAQAIRPRPLGLPPAVADFARAA